MSSVSGVSQNLQSFFQTASVSRTSSPATADATTGTQPADTSAVQGAGRHSHHRGGGPGGPGGGAFKDIESAVTTALQAAKANGSTDTDQVIQDAIGKVLASKGGATSPTDGQTDPAKTNPDTSTDTDTDTDAASQTDATSQSDSSGSASSSRQAFFDTLKSLGVDPKQFRQDFKAALQASRGGTADPATAFKSFPPGSIVDTTA